MANRATLAAIGEVLFDCFPDGDRLGGAPFNFAWHAQALGADTLFVSGVGADERGDLIRAGMSRRGLDLSGLQVLQTHPTGIVRVSLDSAGGHEFEIVQDQAYDHLDAAPVRDLLRKHEPDLLYFGTLASRHPTSRTAVRAATEAGIGVRLLDVNLRSGCWTEETLTACLEAATVVKLNDEELATMSRLFDLGAGGVETGEALRRRFGLETVLVTRGARGAWWLQGGQPIEAVSPSVEIMDTVGAGDGFAAVTAIGLQAGWQAAETLQRAALFAARLCERRGACPEEDAFYEPFRRDWGLEGVS